MMKKFVVPYDDDDYGDTDVWHSLTAAFQKFRQFLLFRHFRRRCIIFFGYGLVIFLTFVRNMVIGNWLRCFFIVVKRVLYVDMDESIAFENCCERTM